MYLALTKSTYDQIITDFLNYNMFILLGSIATVVVRTVVITCHLLMPSLNEQSTRPVLTLPWPVIYLIGLCVAAHVGFALYDVNFRMHRLNADMSRAVICLAIAHFSDADFYTMSVMELWRPMLYLAYWFFSRPYVPQNVALYLQIGCKHGIIETDPFGPYSCAACRPDATQHTAIRQQYHNRRRFWSILFELPPLNVW